MTRRLIIAVTGMIFLRACLVIVSFDKKSDRKTTAIFGNAEGISRVAGRTFFGKAEDDVSGAERAR